MLQGQRQAMEQGGEPAPSVAAGVVCLHFLTVANVAMYVPYQAQSFAVRADQDVLAVVKRTPVNGYTAGAATQLLCGFVHSDGRAGRAQFDGGGKPGPTAADDSDRQRGAKGAAGVFQGLSVCPLRS